MAFWRQRFKETNEDQEIAEQGKHQFSLIINTGRDLGLKIAGEEESHSKVKDMRDRKCTSFSAFVNPLGQRADGNPATGGPRSSTGFSVSCQVYQQTLRFHGL